uniref:HMG box domain-containing protein n=1 Tax=Amphora coffeiformis TaxID=265554 RepID=A0A7S3KVV2_9STRA|mmetsp:Transcript_11945/g.22841  ORF Transcript_11945/g.22841 Transcript_11945/m.22841 type:complete len:186 (-) Transcript_11945:205-762(-)
MKMDSVAIRKNEEDLCKQFDRSISPVEDVSFDSREPNGTIVQEAVAQKPFAPPVSTIRPSCHPRCTRFITALYRSTQTRRTLFSSKWNVKTSSPDWKKKNRYPPEDVPYELAKAWKSMKKWEKGVYVRLARMEQRMYNKELKEWKKRRRRADIPVLNLPPVHQRQNDGTKLETSLHLGGHSRHEA